MSNLMSKQGSFWMILSSAVATRPEVILEAAHFPQFPGIRSFGLLTAVGSSVQWSYGPILMSGY